MCDLSKSKWRVLVEDDDANWRSRPGEVLAEIFPAGFFDIQVAEDVSQSITKLKEAWQKGKPFDLIFADIAEDQGEGRAGVKLVEKTLSFGSDSIVLWYTAYFANHSTARRAYYQHQKRVVDLFKFGRESIENPTYCQRFFTGILEQLISCRLQRASATDIGKAITTLEAGRGAIPRDFWMMEVHTSNPKGDPEVWQMSSLFPSTWDFDRIVAILRGSRTASLSHLWEIWRKFESTSAHELKTIALLRLREKYENGAAEPVVSYVAPDIIKRFEEIATMAMNYSDEVKESQLLFRVNQSGFKKEDAFLCLVLMAHLPVAFYVACRENQQKARDEWNKIITFRDLGHLIGMPGGLSTLRFVQQNRAWPCLVVGRHSVTQAVRILCANLNHAYPTEEKWMVTVGWEGREPETSERVIFKFRDHGKGIDFRGQQPLKWYQDAFSDKGSDNKFGHLKTILELHNGCVEVVTSTHPGEIYSTKTKGLISVNTQNETDSRFLPSAEQPGTCFRLVMEPLVK